MDQGGYREFPIFESRNFYQSRIEVPLFVRTLRLPRSARILEVGCGPGVALPVLERLLAPTRVVGVDIDDGLLRAAGRRIAEEGGSAELMRADVRDLPFADGSFDVVVDFGTCYHIARSDLALDEIARVLAVGGVFATEAKLAQILSHPIRTFGRKLGVERCTRLAPRRHAGMWTSFRKVA
ncbi:MAG: class I SAM-dependent methyltransferase [Gemmatimonadota bacterium]|nr:class I SAM-dependent methyltransferase [Gemmatimonadota bacterium]